MKFKVSETISHIRVDIDSLKDINRLADFIEKSGEYTVTQTSTYRNLGQSHLIMFRNRPAKSDEIAGLIKIIEGIVQKFIAEKNENILCIATK